MAILTGMEEPLGFAIGNNMEVKEAIEVLKGDGPEDVKEVSVALAGMMLSLGLENVSHSQGKRLFRPDRHLENSKKWYRRRAAISVM